MLAKNVHELFATENTLHFCKVLTVENISLSSYVHACARFELHCDLFFVDRYFLKQPANQLLIVFRDVLRLLCKELLHFADANSNYNSTK